MMNEQSSSAVYGVFFEEDYEGQVLVGLYFLEGEAEAARQAYIADQLKDFSAEQLNAPGSKVQDHYEHAVVVRRLAMGQAPRYNFAG